MKTKLYAIDRRTAGECINHNGHGERVGFWQEVGKLRASRAGKALQHAAGFMPGSELRARLVLAGLEGV